jgi:Flp pilus assembly protein TadG
MILPTRISKLDEKSVTMKKINNERGQSLVEMAISLVLLLMLLSGAVEFGMAFFQYIQLRDAAQEGALYGSMNPTDVTNIALRTKGASSSPIKLTTDPNVTLVIQYSDVNKKCEGNAITVQLTYQHKVFMPFLPTVIGSYIPLKASVTDTILSPLC